MSGSQKDRLAALVIDQQCVFQEAVAGNRKRYPTPEFEPFAAVMRQCVDATHEDKMLHRGVVTAVYGLAPSICEANVSGRRTTSCSRLKDWNVCSSLATIRTSMVMSLRVGDLAVQDFSNPIVSVDGEAAFPHLVSQSSALRQPAMRSAHPSRRWRSCHIPNPYPVSSLETGGIT